MIVGGYAATQQWVGDGEVVGHLADPCVGVVPEADRGRGRAAAQAVAGQPFDPDGDLTSPLDAQAGDVQFEFHVGRDPVECVGGDRDLSVRTPPVLRPVR